MGIASIKLRAAKVFYQRCFYLFVSLVVLIAVAPFMGDIEHGRFALQVAQVLVLLAAVAAVGRTTLSFVIALLLGAPPVLMQLAVILGLEDVAPMTTLALGFYVSFYVVAIVYLLRYVFSPDVMTDDKLFGAAAGYMMLGIAWAFAYSLVQAVNPGTFRATPGAPTRSFYDLLYMSFGVLTSNGPGDVVVASTKVKALVIMEQVAGTLFVAILIARLAGIYPARPSKES